MKYETIDKRTAAKAAEAANKRFGQWMPEQWLWLFVDEYDKAVSADHTTPSPRPCDGADGTEDKR